MNDNHQIQDAQHSLRSANESPRVLIIILNYLSYELTLKLIKSLKADLAYDNYEIAVIDNCSPNESARVLSENSYEMGYIFIANDKNTGYASGNNIGIRCGIESEFKYSWILNNDIEIVDNRVLAYLVSVAEKDRGIGCIGPRIITKQGDTCAPYCRRPCLWSLTFGLASERRFRKTRSGISGEVYRVYGCCMLLRNDSMQEVDCFDERTFLYCEEDILAERLMKRGYTTYYLAEVCVKHNESSSVAQTTLSKKRNLIREVNKSFDLYLREYRGFTPIAIWACKAVRAMIIYLR